MGSDRNNKPKTNGMTPNAYLRRLERVVELVENAKTHYDALGVRPTATAEEILRAHQRVVGVLNPLYHKSTALLSADTEDRIEKAFQQVTVALSILNNYSRRIEYDESIGVHGIARELQTRAGSGNRECLEPHPLPLDKAVQQPSAAREPKSTRPAASQKSADNRRRTDRRKQVLPVRVSGYDRTGGEWSELTETIDVSRTGSRLRLRRRVRHRTLVQLSLPLPSELRSHGGLDDNYNVYALVRRVDGPRDGRRIVGLEFVGENPPPGFREKPWATFHMKWTGDERRREPRVPKSETVTIEYLDDAMLPLRRDQAVTENIGPRGMRIRLSKPAPEFDLVKIIRGDEKRESVAAVSDRYFDKDGLERICLRFISNTPAPAHVAEHRVERAPANGKKILIADDDPLLRKVLGKILTEAGYEVVVAEDGERAVEKAASERPHLVIADGLMPKMHGFLACKMIKQMQSPPKVILLTAVYTKKNYKWEARQQYGADDFLTKPFELSELFACIEKHLANSPCA
jgi:CheY-like chemotaxis protein/curved DNA-binding protein CbpA